MSNRVRIWDLPTRIFHWALAAAVIGLFITAYTGGNAMVWHFRLGYTVLALLAFRIVWGLVGGRWSRFASFIYSPTSLSRYLRGQSHPDHLVGHNPLGAGSVFALLGFLAAQVATGLISDDEIAFAGPLTKFVSGATVSRATWYHKDVGQWVLAGLVALHVAAILFYLWRKKENLVRPMIVGDKRVHTGVQPSRDDALSRIAAAMVLGICGALVAWLVRLGG